jgi:hypothetical protein
LDDSFKPKQPWQEPRLSWLGNVRLQQVHAEGPGSRAYRSDLQLKAVVPTKDFPQYSAVGLYLVSIASILPFTSFAGVRQCW